MSATSELSYPYVPGRRRYWHAHFFPGSGMVQVIRYICDISPDEKELNDTPPTVSIPYTEWPARCKEFGLNEDGSGDGNPGVDD